MTCEDHWYTILISLNIQIQFSLHNNFKCFVFALKTHYNSYHITYHAPYYLIVIIANSTFFTFLRAWIVEGGRTGRMMMMHRFDMSAVFFALQQSSNICIAVIMQCTSSNFCHKKLVLVQVSSYVHALHVHSLHILKAIKFNLSHDWLLLFFVILVAVIV